MTFAEGVLTAFSMRFVDLFVTMALLVNYGFELYFSHTVYWVSFGMDWIFPRFVMP